MGLAHGIGIGISFKRSSGSWSSFWSHQPEVLFFGLYSEISDGKMPNKVPGATDYLTVAGSAGSETFKCSNTAAYIAADTDKIWFDIGVNQRTALTSELIGYDFTRTIVYYGNSAPYSIVAIMILSSNLDTDKMRDDFDLSIWWSGVLSSYGNLKGNRGASKSTWNEWIIYDTFTGANDTLLSAHVPDVNLGGGYTLLNDFRITGNKAVSTTSGGYASAFMVVTGKANFDMTIELTLPNQDNFAGGVVFRRNASTSFWSLLVLRIGGGANLLIRMDVLKAGTATEDLIHFNPVFVAGKGILRLVVSGNTHDVYWNGVKGIDGYVGDGTYATATTHGLRCYQDATYKEIQYDNFRIKL